MKMDGVYVITRVSHANAVALPLSYMETGIYCFARHWVSYSVDRPTIKPILGGVVLRECHIEGLIRRAGSGARFAKERIVPTVAGRYSPFRVARMVRVLDDNSHTVMAIVIIEIAQNPHPRMIHVHGGRDPLPGSEPEHRNRCWIGNRISIQGNDVEGMPGKCKAANFGRAAVQNMEKYAFTFLYSNG